MGMPKRLVVDGLLLCKGWNGEGHVVDFETGFYDKANGNKSSMCKACISKGAKERRDIAREEKLRACTIKSRIKMPVGSDARMMMMPFVRKCK